MVASKTRPPGILLLAYQGRTEHGGGASFCMRHAQVKGGGGHVLYIPYSKMCKFSIVLSIGVTMFCMSCAKPTNLGSIRMHMMVQMPLYHIYDLHLEMQKERGRGASKCTLDHWAQQKSSTLKGLFNVQI